MTALRSFRAHARVCLSAGGHAFLAFSKKDSTYDVSSSDALKRRRKLKDSGPRVRTVGPGPPALGPHA